MTSSASHEKARCRRITLGAVPTSHTPSIELPRAADPEEGDPALFEDGRHLEPDHVAVEGDRRLESSDGHVGLEQSADWNVCGD